MSRFREMQAFVDAAEKGSLTGAALEQRITPSMLGRRISDLERRLGVKLLHRTTRHMSMTEQGTLFLEHCRELLTELEAHEAAVFPESSHATGQLSVIAPAYVGRHHVAAHVRKFISENPQAQVSFNLSNSYVDPVHEGYDLCIRIGNVIDPDFVATKLATNRRVVCATPSYFQEYGVPQTLQDLAAHNCLAVNRIGGEHRDWLFQEDGKPVAVKVNGNFDCNDGEVLARWVCNGLCLAWRSTWEVSAQLDSGELVTALDQYALPSFDIMAIYPRHKPLTAKVKLFIETLKAAYAQPGYWT